MGDELFPFLKNSFRSTCRRRRDSSKRYAVTKQSRLVFLVFPLYGNLTIISAACLCVIKLSLENLRSKMIVCIVRFERVLLGDCYLVNRLWEPGFWPFGFEEVSFFAIG